MLQLILQTQVSLLDGDVVEEEEEFELVGAEVYLLQDALLYPAADHLLVLIPGEDTHISHHISLTTPVSQLLHHFNLIRQTLLNLTA